VPEPCECATAPQATAPEPPTPRQLHTGPGGHGAGAAAPGPSCAAAPAARKPHGWRPLRWGHQRRRSSPGSGVGPPQPQPPLREEREGGEVDLECGAMVSAGIYLAWEEQQHRWIEDLTLRKILNDVATLRPRRGHNEFRL